MAYAITASKWLEDKRYIEAVLDSADDLEALGDGYAPDSRAIVADGGAAYMTDASGQWQELGSPGGGGSAPVLETLTATENRTYTPDVGVDGFDKVEVDVPLQMTLWKTLQVGTTFDLRTSMTLMQVKAGMAVLTASISANKKYVYRSGVPMSAQTLVFEGSSEDVYVETIYGSGYGEVSAITIDGDPTKPVASLPVYYAALTYPE